MARFRFHRRQQAPHQCVEFQATFAKALELLQRERTRPANGAGAVFLPCQLDADALLDALQQFGTGLRAIRGKQWLYFVLREAKPAVCLGIRVRAETR